MKLVYRRVTESELTAIPFSPGSVYFTTDSGKLYIDPIDATKRILIGGDGNGGASVQPDWYQNDSTQPDFIKNKTHWEENGQTVIEWDGNTDGRDSFVFSNSDNNVTFYKVSDIIPLPSEVIGGTEVFTNNDGTVFSYTITSDSVYENEGCFSALEVLFITKTDFTFNGVSITAPSTGCYFPYLGGNYISNITYNSVIVHQIDEKFIPDTIARISDITGGAGSSVQSDWNQTDETKPDFIKNKPNEKDALELVAEIGLVVPIADDDGNVYTDENGNIYTL